MALKNVKKQRAQPPEKGTAAEEGLAADKGEGAARQTPSWRLGDTANYQWGPWARADFGILAALLLIAFMARQPIAPVVTMGTDLTTHDAVINSYLACWVADTWWRAPSQVFDIPFFYPATNALVNSDPIIVPGIIVTPFWLISGGNFVFAYNMGMLMALWTAMAAMYLLLRDTTPLPRAACILGAIFFGINTDRWWHDAGHFNQMWTFVLPLAFWAAWRLMARPGWRTAAAAALAGLTAHWCSFYLLVFATGAGLIGCIAATVALKIRPGLRHLIWLGAAGALAILLMAPTVSIYVRASQSLMSQRGGISENILHSASFTGYFLPPFQPERIITPLAALLETPEAEPWTKGEDAQFIGYGLLLLLLAEICRLLWLATKRKKWGGLDRLSALGLFASIVLLLVSLGPYMFGNVQGPFVFLYEVFLKHLRFFRTPARFATLVQLFTVFPAIIYLTTVLRDKTNGIMVAALIFGALCIAEHWPVGFAERAAIDQRFEPMMALELKDPTQTHPFYAAPDPQNCYMGLSSRADGKWRPMINAWTFPPVERWYDDFTIAMSDFPSTRSLGFLASIEPTPWVITHDKNYTRRSLADPRLEVTRMTSPDEALVKIINPEAAKAAWQEYRQRISASLTQLRSELFGDKKTSLLVDGTGIYDYVVRTEGLISEEIVGTGYRLTPTGELDARLIINSNTPQSAQAFDVLEIILESERHLEGKPLKIYWQQYGAHFTEGHARIGAFERVGPGSDGMTEWRVQFPMYTHPDWYFLDYNFDSYLFRFLEYDPRDKRPFLFKKVLGHRLAEVPLPAMTLPENQRGEK